MLRVLLLAAQPANAVIQLRPSGTVADQALPVLRAGDLRALAPPDMILELRPSRERSATPARPRA